MMVARHTAGPAYANLRGRAGSPEEVRKLAGLLLGALSFFWPAFAFALGETVFVARQHLAECAPAH